MIRDAGQPVCHVHQALLLTGRQHTRLWNHNFGQFWVSLYLGILDNLDVADFFLATFVEFEVFIGCGTTIMGQYDVLGILEIWMLQTLWTNLISFQ